MQQQTKTASAHDDRAGHSEEASTAEGATEVRIATGDEGYRGDQAQPEYGASKREVHLT